MARICEVCGKLDESSEAIVQGDLLHVCEQCMDDRQYPFPPADGRLG